MRLVAEDALAEFPTHAVTVATHCAPAFAGVALCNNRICAVSIVRSGDCLLEAVRAVEPGVSVGKILVQRDESCPHKTAQLYNYSKLPPTIHEQHVLLCDPMLATGGSACAALRVLVEEAGVEPSNIILATMICAPEGLRVLAEQYPQIKIVTACVDEGLNEKKFIVPGLGDYGDRFFNT